ncbi:hypothetical protein GCM10020295_77580 [Streptomyces cinereospinus]
MQETRPSRAVLSAALVVTAAGAAGAVALAPETARTWVAGTAIVAWACMAAVATTASVRLRRALRRAEARSGELEMTKNNWMQHGAETDQLVNTTLPAIARQLAHGTSADDILAGTPTPPTRTCGGYCTSSPARWPNPHGGPPRRGRRSSGCCGNGTGG